MVVATSAIIASVANEPDSTRFQAAMRNAGNLAISAVTVLETRIVLHARFNEDALRAFDQMLGRAGFEIVPFDSAMAAFAFAAFRQFGKGQAHPAQLNIVDCAAYALAAWRNEPLLFKGDDFRRTDIISAL